jgi:hypothetical protein
MLSMPRAQRRRVAMGARKNSLRVNDANIPRGPRTAAERLIGKEHR